MRAMDEIDAKDLKALPMRHQQSRGLTIELTDRSIDQQRCHLDELASQACRAKRYGVAIGAVNQKRELIAKSTRSRAPRARGAQAFTHLLLVSPRDCRAGVLPI